MRTTLDIEDDVLQAAKETAAMERTSVGRVISTWARRGLLLADGKSGDGKKKRIRNGVPLLPSRGEIITMEHIQKIMDEEGI